MKKGRFIIGIILMIIAVVIFFYIDDIKDDKIGFFGTLTLEKIAQMCNAGWGDIFNITGQCLKVQLFYYSPWISGIIGIIILVKSRSHYHGRRNPKF